MENLSPNNESPEVFEPWAVPDFLVSFFREIDESLRYKTRFSIPTKQNEHIVQYINRRIATGLGTIPAGKIFYRARIHEFGKKDLYKRKEMGAPPNGKAGSGRMNPEGISYLYLANSSNTAIAEIRPWKGATLSVGKFKTQKELRIVSLSKSIEITDPTDTKTTTKFVIDSILHALYFSIPAHGEDKFSYLASQYIAEQFKQRNVDGIEYPSVLNEEGTNTVLFDIDSAICINVTGHAVEKISYSSRRWNPPKKK
ncbi:MAG TPA: hypothetical protein DIW64_18610 [Cellvibrio sp.]|nr:hypothetical protein [Cellvibrio sp.]